MTCGCNPGGSCGESTTSTAMTNQTSESRLANAPAGTSHARSSEPSMSYQPAFDLIAGESAFTLRADMPGASAESIDVAFERGELRVLAKVASRMPQGARALREEYGVGDYHLRVGLRQPVDADAISAAYEDGVLTVTLPKPASVMPRKIGVTKN